LPLSFVAMIMLIPFHSPSTRTVIIRVVLTPDLRNCAKENDALADFIGEIIYERLVLIVLSLAERNRFGYRDHVGLL